MKDEAEQSNPSTGSVAGEPIAWGIQFWGGDLHREVFDTEEQAEREMYRGSPPGVCTAKVVSLHLKPTLTDEEREDLQMWATECLRQCSGATDGGDWDAAERWSGRAARAAAMLQRLK
jgi:hypothetical protein